MKELLFLLSLKEIVVGFCEDMECFRDMIVLKRLNREIVTDLSFHLIAFLDSVAISKVLLKPRWPTS